MSEKGYFSTTEQMNTTATYEVYQKAFQGDPWYEVTKCADNNERLMRCEGGFSRLALGELCNRCGERPTEPAYTNDDLEAKFKSIEDSSDTEWYVETVNGETALIALAWGATPGEIFQKRYSDVPEMEAWLAGELGDESQKVVYLDEIFANKAVRETGNLRNFGYLVNSLLERYDSETFVFRTINQRLIEGAKKRLGERVTVWRSGIDVLDRRDFVRIEKVGEEA